MEKSPNIGFLDKMEAKMGKLKNFGSEKLKNFGSAVSKKTAPIKRTGSNVNLKLKNMLSFNISGPFFGLLYSFVLLYALYYASKRIFVQMEYNNTTKFIEECLDIWFYLMIVIIIFSTIIQL